jgi:hypothetical protein
MPAESVRWREFTPLGRHSQLGFSATTTDRVARPWLYLACHFGSLGGFQCVCTVTKVLPGYDFGAHYKLGGYLLLPGHPLLTEVNALFSDVRLHEYFSPRESNAL